MDKAQRNRDILENVLSGHTLRAVGAEYGLTPQMVHKICLHAGLSIRDIRNRSFSASNSTIAEEYASGVSANELSVKYGMKASSIRNICRNLGVPGRKRQISQKTRDMAVAYQNGEGACSIAKRYGVSSRSVQGACKRMDVSQRTLKGAWELRRRENAAKLKAFDAITSILSRLVIECLRYPLCETNIMRVAREAKETLAAYDAAERLDKLDSPSI